MSHITQPPISITGKIKGVLFDLDGTLVDSAPDLGAAADKMRTDRGLESYPLEKYRALAGAGARGMLYIAFNMTPQDPQFEAMREEFFCNYEACMTQRTKPFANVADMLKALDERQIPWGIVTNKMERFALPLLEQSPWAKNARAHVGGDTTPHMKPHPAPVLEGAKQIQIAPEHCLYVGDDLRDVQSGNAAGMYTAAATWGYLGENNDFNTWQADFVVHKPGDIIRLL